MDQQSFSDLVGAIYDCAIAPERWPETLERLRLHFGFALATIDLHRLPEMGQLLNHTAGLGEEDRREMLRLAPHAVEIWGGLQASMARPIDRPWVLSRITPPEALAQMVYQREWAAPRRLADSAAIILARDAGLIGTIGFATHEDLGVISDRMNGELAMIVPH